ncbi:hypothetical protein Tco_1102583 [Tanacetum coccineum]
MLTVTASQVIETSDKKVRYKFCPINTTITLFYQAPNPRGQLKDSIDLNGATRNTTHLRLFCFTLRDQAINWLDLLPARSISTWDDLTTCFQLQQTYLRKVPHRGLDLWLQVQIFYDHVNYTTQMAIDDAACGRLRKLRPEEAWKTIEDSAQYEEE